jgi:hypothetical protein
MQQMSRPLTLDGTVLEVENITCHGYGVLRSYSRVLADSPLSLDSFCTLLSEAGLPARTLLYVEHTEDRYFEIATSDRLFSILIHTFFLVFFRSNSSKMLKSLILDGLTFLFDIFILGNFNFRAQILILKTAVYSSKIHQNSFTQIVTTYYL